VRTKSKEEKVLLVRKEKFYNRLVTLGLKTKPDEH
jgi:hypothetical protein